MEGNVIDEHNKMVGEVKIIIKIKLEYVLKKCNSAFISHCILEVVFFYKCVKGILNHWTY